MRIKRKSINFRLVSYKCFELDKNERSPVNRFLLGLYDKCNWDETNLQPIQNISIISSQEETM